MAPLRLTLVHLYPDLMNVYGDRGNILTFRRRCAWRGIELDVQPVSLGDRLNPDTCDLIFFGGGQDREQAVISPDFVSEKGEVVREAVEDGRGGAGRLRRLPAARAHLHHGGRPGIARRRRLRRPVRARDAPAHRQPGGRGEPGRHAPHAGGLREPQRPDVPRAGRQAAGAGAPGRRQQRRGRHRGGGLQGRLRLLPARLAAAEEPVAGRPAARAGAAAAVRRGCAPAGAARRHARRAGARRRRRAGRGASAPCAAGPGRTGDVPPRSQAGGGLAGGDGRLRGEPAARAGPQRGGRPAVRDRARVRGVRRGADDPGPGVPDPGRRGRRLGVHPRLQVVLRQGRRRGRLAADQPGDDRWRWS